MQPLQQTANPLILRKKSVGVDFFKAYQQQDVSQMLSLCAADCQVSFLPLGENGKGNVHQVGKAIWESLIASFPSINNSVESIELKDGQVHCHVVIRGKQEKDFGGLMSKGNEFEEGHIFIFRLNKDNKVENLRINWDHESLVKQLTA